MRVRVPLTAAAWGLRPRRAAAGTRVVGGDLVACGPPARHPGGGGWSPTAVTAAPVARPGSSGRSTPPIGFSRAGAARQRRHVAVVPHCTNW